MYNNTQVEYSTYTYSETCINCLPTPTSVEESNTIQMNGGYVWKTARDHDIHCTEFFVSDFTSNVKRSKWVKWRLRVRIARWLIFLKTSRKGIVYLSVFRISFLLVYLTILMQLDVIWLPLRLNFTEMRRSVKMMDISFWYLLGWSCVCSWIFSQIRTWSH